METLAQECSFIYLRYGAFAKSHLSVLFAIASFIIVALLIMRTFLYK